MGSVKLGFAQSRSTRAEISRTSTPDLRAPTRQRWSASNGHVLLARLIIGGSKGARPWRPMGPIPFIFMHPRRIWDRTRGYPLLQVGSGTGLRTRPVTGIPPPPVN